VWEGDWILHTEYTLVPDNGPKKANLKEQYEQYERNVERSRKEADGQALALEKTGTPYLVTVMEILLSIPNVPAASLTENLICEVWKRMLYMRGSGEGPSRPPQTLKQKTQAFLEELTKLTVKYGIEIGSCGCCESMFLVNLSDADRSEKCIKKYGAEYCEEKDNEDLLAKNVSFDYVAE
jgi:hypothetical protein